MTLPRFLSQAGNDASELEELLAGLPTIGALARLCSLALSQPGPAGNGSAIVLTAEAEAILCAARKRGIFEVKGTNQEFESTRRLLAIYVETEANCYLVFRDQREPEVTIRFLDGFRQLCEAGLVMHQMGAEFSLTRSGFERAAGLQESTLQDYLEMGYTVS